MRLRGGRRQARQRQRDHSHKPAPNPCSSTCHGNPLRVVTGAFGPADGVTVLTLSTPQPVICRIQQATETASARIVTDLAMAEGGLEADSITISVRWVTAARGGSFDGSGLLACNRPVL